MLWWRLERLRWRGRDGVTAFESVLAARAGGEVTESWLERQFLRTLRNAGVEPPACQARIAADGAFVAQVDFFDQELKVVYEVTGAVGHSTPRQRAADARRRNQLGMLGYLVVEFLYEQVVGDPSGVVDAVRQARARRAAPAARRLDALHAERGRAAS